jgi:hypothetical protein
MSLDASSEEIFNNLENAYTISFSFKPDTVETHAQYILRICSDYTQTGDDKILLKLINNNKIILTHLGVDEYSNDKLQEIEWNLPEILSVENWYNFGLVYETQSTKLYFNNTLLEPISSYEKIDSLKTSGYNQILIGKPDLSIDSISSSGRLFGSISYLFISAKAFTTLEIVNIHNGSIYQYLLDDVPNTYIPKSYLWEFNNGSYKNTILSNTSRNLQYDNLINGDLEWTVNDVELQSKNNRLDEDIVITETETLIQFPVSEDYGHFVSIPAIKEDMITEKNNLKFTIRLIKATEEYLYHILLNISSSVSTTAVEYKNVNIRALGYGELFHDFSSGFWGLANANI